MLNEIHKSIMALNGNSYFVGILMLLMNIGSKYVSIELSKTQEQFIKNKIGRQLLIFSIVWMGVRDIYKSLIITAIFVLLADHLFNENSNFCILPKQMRLLRNAIDVNDDNEISEQEINNALQVLDKAKRQVQMKNKLSALNNFIQ
jgi:hypothetical protein